MARDYSLAFTLFGLDTPIIDVRTGLATEAMRLWQENITTNLYGPTGAEDVTLAIPTGSYVGAVSVAPNKGLSVSGVVGPAYTATLDLAQDIRVTASPTFVTLTLTGNLVIGGLADGRDISADGNKLDTIETGATADQTAAEILTAIKTVDGVGSGLDADLLDGQSGTYYLSRVNHTGTQNLSTIGDVSITAANLNTLDDGFDTTLHFHASDRARANHTGTQAWGTIISTPTTTAGYGITDAYTKSEVDTAVGGKVTKDASITAASTSHAVTDFATTNAALDALGAKINEIIDALNA